MAFEIRLRRKLALVAIGVAALAGVRLFGLADAQQVRAQSPAPDWQVAAGGKMSFDVASVRQNTSGVPPSGDRASTNVGLDPGDYYTPTGGLLRATNWPLSAYIGFAYKLAPTQVKALQSDLPKWANADRFDIEARASGNPTKNQMRLMMQSLLADRLKMAAHFETKQMPEFAMVLAKAGETGPQLVPYADGPSCDRATPSPSTSPTPKQPAKDDAWFVPCGGLVASFTSGHVRIGSRDLTMTEIANSLVVASMGALDRPVVDQTGLRGNFDFRIEFTPEGNRFLPPTFQPDAEGPTFLEALKDQLGLKLESQTGPVDILVIDHVEEPSEN